MAPDAQIASRDDVSTETEPSLAELLDPIALEERLKEARLRRAAALERRKAGVATMGPGPATPMPVLPVSARRPLPPLRPSPRLAGVSPDPLTLASSGAPQAATVAATGLNLSRRYLARLAAMPVWLTFVAGLGLGAAGVTVAVTAFRTQGIAPETEIAESPADPATNSATLAADVATLAAAPVSSPSAVAPVVPATEIAALSQPPHPGAQPAEVPAAEVGPAAGARPADLAEPAVENEAVVPAGTLSPATLPAPEAFPPAGTSPVQAPRAVALPPRATVHFPRSAGGAAETAAAALRARGVAVEILPVDLAIARTNVRFYHHADQAGAERVSALLAEALSVEPPLTRDFTTYATPPVSGKVEIWLAGTTSEPRPPAAPAIAAEASEPARPAASGGLPSNPAVYDPSGPAPAVVPQSQAEEIARIVVERAYQRLLQETPAR